MLVASIIEIQSCDNLHIVKFDFDGQTLSMLSLELPKDIQLKKNVNLSIKPTAISIAKNFISETSFENQLKTSIKSITDGKLLTTMMLSSLDGIVFEAIITKELANNLALKVGDDVVAVIKASDISIAEVLDD
ncbi:MAG: TOBE domain-containing protein [Campylobacterales bacterium]